jgi:hypothetical protein
MWNLGTNSAFALGPRKTLCVLAGRSQDLPDAKWLLASSLALVPICAVAFFYKLFLHIFLCAYNLDENQTVYNTCRMNERLYGKLPHSGSFPSSQASTHAARADTSPHTYMNKCTSICICDSLTIPPQKLITQWSLCIEQKAFLFADPSELAEEFNSF